MNYFKILGMVFGLAAFLKPVYMHVLPWDEFGFIKKAYADERPKWVVLVALVGILLTAFTWYKYFTTDIEYSLVVTILFSLTIIKALALIFNYRAFQKWVKGMLKKHKKQIVWVDIFASFIGLVIFIFSVWFI